MIRRCISLLGVAALVGTFLAAMAGTSTASSSAETVRLYDRDCGDFSSQAAAQSFYVANGGPHSDPHGLDAEGDGVACETSPCPCSTSSGGGGGAASSAPPAKTRVVKVLNGELVRVRKGSQKPYTVHLMGVEIPKGRCYSRTARRDLRSWVKPGMEVEVVDMKKSRKRDKDGHIYRYLVRVKGNYDVGGSQIDTGFGIVDPGLSFKLRSEYTQWQDVAIAEGRGFHGLC